MQSVIFKTYNKSIWLENQIVSSNFQKILRLDT